MKTTENGLSTLAVKDEQRGGGGGGERGDVERITGSEERTETGRLEPKTEAAENRVIDKETVRKMRTDNKKKTKCVVSEE